MIVDSYFIGHLNFEKRGRIMDNRTIGLICQATSGIVGLISIIVIIKQNPVVVAGLILSAGLYFVGRFIKDRL